MQNGTRRTFAAALLAPGLVALLAAPAMGQDQAAAPPGRGKPEISKPIAFDVSKPLRDIEPIRPVYKGPHEKPIHILGRDATVRADGAVQTTTGPLVAATLGTSFEGVGLGNGYNVDAAPPDTNGSVGLTHYVQWVNESFAVFDKTTGAQVYPQGGGGAAGNTLWSGFGGGCQNNNDGDPIVLYDKLANRWFMTQFSVSNQPYMQCIAVSKTSDPMGAWSRYAYTFQGFPDYGKFGVWPSAYFAGYNMFSGESGSKACAYDRAAMIAGTAANQVCFNVSRQGLIPTDFDGTLQPDAGTPNYYLDFGTNSLDYWQFTTGNFSTGAGFALTGPTNLPVAAFAAACGGGGACIEQGGSRQKLDSLADRLMYRLAYRRFSDHESLVINHSVTVGATKGKSGATGLRWYELRRAANGTLSVGQQGTFSPDTSARWMGSMAMDKAGNIALGYSKSSASMDPAIFYTGRSATDAAGTMQAEASLKTGTGSQGRSLTRWGDYSSLSVDPSNDCTLWYTTEYLANDGTFNWHTWVGSVKFPNCN